MRRAAESVSQSSWEMVGFFRALGQCSESAVDTFLTPTLLARDGPAPDLRVEGALCLLSLDENIRFARSSFFFRARPGDAVSTAAWNSVGERSGREHTLLDDLVEA